MDLGLTRYATVVADSGGKPDKPAQKYLAEARDQVVNKSRPLKHWIELSGGGTLDAKTDVPELWAWHYFLRHGTRKWSKPYQAYLDALPKDAKRALSALRAAVRAAAPGVEDAWSYGIPAFRHEGRMLVGYSAWKDYVSLYPFGTAVLRAQARALEGYDMSKGSIRFPLPDPPPAKVITRIIRACLAEDRPPKRP